MRARFLCLLMILAGAGFAPGQSGGAVTVPAGVPADIYAQPATMDLIAGKAGAHSGKIWIRSSDEGLHIWGKVQVSDDDLHWPTEKSEMLSSDHVEIWLSAATNVKMPPVGYGNQFGEVSLTSAADCGPMENEGGPGSPRVADVKSCERWYNDQLEYRKLFERLFTRQWLAAGPGKIGQQSSFFEDYASSAWASLNAAFFEPELPKPLEPRADKGMVSEFNTESGKQVKRTNAYGVTENWNVVTGYKFHFFIPWSAFPPAQQLDLRDLWLMVDVFGAAEDGKKTGTLSTTSAQRVWGKPASFNHLVLAEPRRHEVTPCRAADTEEDMYGKAHAAWYFPMAGAGPHDLSTDYDIENPAGGYMYDPGGVSPIFRANEHFWKILADGAAVCGPELAYRKGGVAQSSSFFIDKEYFETKAMRDGWTLVRTGPDMSTISPFGSGECGACPVVDFHVYAISPAGQITAALDINDAFTGLNGSASDGDFDLAPDWTRVTFFEEFVTYPGDGQEEDTWTARSYCLQGHVYNKCGEDKNAKPPNPPNFKLEDD